MNIALAINTTVLLHGEFEKYQHLDSPVLFMDQDKQVWNYIKKNYEKNKKVPSLDSFRLEFPEPTYHFDKTAETGHYYNSSELVDLAYKRQRGNEITETMVKVIDARKANDLDAAEQAMREHLDKPKPGAVEDMFPVLTRSQLASLPTPTPIIRGVLDEGTIVVLDGQQASYKSFLALDWACCVATGHSWHGHSVEQGKVLYIAAEGAYGQERRLVAWESHNGRNVKDEFFDCIPKAVQLGNNQDVDWICNLIRKNEYSLIVVDTLSQSTAGMDENQAKDMSKVLGNIMRMRNAAENVRTTILVVHHVGKNQAAGSRGSTVIPYNSDGGYRMERKDKEKKVKLTCTKYKDGPDDLEMHFEAQQELDSLVLVEYVPAIAKDWSMKQAISDFMEKHQTSTITEIRDNVEGANDVIGQAVKELITDGFLATQAKKTVFVKPWQTPF